MHEDARSDAAAVEQVAREMIRDFGSDATDVAYERAEVAEAIGDLLSAEAWRDIADAAKRLASALVVENRR